MSTIAIAILTIAADKARLARSNRKASVFLLSTDWWWWWWWWEVNEWERDGTHARGKDDDESTNITILPKSKRRKDVYVYVCVYACMCMCTHIYNVHFVAFLGSSFFILQMFIALLAEPASSLCDSSTSHSYICIYIHILISLVHFFRNTFSGKISFHYSSLREHTCVIYA